jgi:hypothetical protein
MSAWQASTQASHSAAVEWRVRPTTGFLPRSHISMRTAEASSGQRSLWVYLEHYSLWVARTRVVLACSASQTFLCSVASCCFSFARADSSRAPCRRLPYSRTQASDSHPCYAHSDTSLVHNRSSCSGSSGSGRSSTSDIYPLCRPAKLAWLPTRLFVQHRSMAIAGVVAARTA